MIMLFGRLYELLYVGIGGRWVLGVMELWYGVVLMLGNLLWLEIVRGCCFVGMNSMLFVDYLWVF